MSIRNITHVRFEDIKYKVFQSKLFMGSPPVGLLHDRLIFVHFPKAGGTSLAHQFRRILKSGLELDYLNDPRIKKAKHRDFPHNKTMVLGHFHPGRYDGARALRLTFLRNPVDSLISTYVFWKYLPFKGDETHRKFLKEQPSIIEFANYSGIKSLMSETYFGGFDMSRFDFIGLEERRGEDITLLARTLGLSLSPEIHINPTEYINEHCELKRDSRIRGIISKIVEKDVIFYDRVKSIANARRI